MVTRGTCPPRLRPSDLPGWNRKGNAESSSSEYRCDSHGAWRSCSQPFRMENMSDTSQTERKWQQQWHDGVIDAIELMLSGFGRALSVECHRGKEQGCDIVISTRGVKPRTINVEVQMHPSGSGFARSMDIWAKRHSKVDATFIVCPMALLPTLARRIGSHSVLGRAENVFIFGDTQNHLTLLCSCVFTYLRT